MNLILTQRLVGNKEQILCVLFGILCAVLAYSLNFQTPSQAKVPVGEGYYHYERVLEGECGDGQDHCYIKSRCHYECGTYQSTCCSTPGLFDWACEMCPIYVYGEAN